MIGSRPVVVRFILTILLVLGYIGILVQHTPISCDGLIFTFWSIPADDVYQLRINGTDHNLTEEYFVTKNVMAREYTTQISFPLKDFKNDKIIQFYPGKKKIQLYIRDVAFTTTVLFKPVVVCHYNMEEFFSFITKAEDLDYSYRDQGRVVYLAVTGNNPHVSLFLPLSNIQTHIPFVTKALLYVFWLTCFILSLAVVWKTELLFYRVWKSFADRLRENIKK